MASKKPQDADDELANLLDSLDTPSTSKPSTSSTSAPHKKLNRVHTADAMDLDAELAALEASATAPRSSTPRISTPVAGKPAPLAQHAPHAQVSNSRLSTDTPRAGSGSARNSEDNRDRGRKSGDSTRSFQNSYAFTPSASPPSQSGAASSIQTAQDKQDKEEAAQVQVDAGHRMSEMLDTAAPAETAKDVKEGKPPVAAAAGGGWWGSIVATAASAAKTAEAAVREIQHNEEAKRWAEQVSSNVGALRGLGKDTSLTLDQDKDAGANTKTEETQLSRRDRLLKKLEKTIGKARPKLAQLGGELSSRALPTFTSLLHTLAPPISSHERLQIHLTHDFLHYPSLDPLIHSTFSRVMAQVEGGDLLVLSRGQNNDLTHKRSRSQSAAQLPGWNDGPWWRDMSAQRDMGPVKGLVEGTKLVRVSAEAFAKEYLDAHGGLEAAAKRATEELSQSNPVRSSDIFLAIQAISHEERGDLFGGGGGVGEKGEGKSEEDGKGEELVCFAIYLHDPIHSITFSTLSQSLPAKWIQWLDAASPSSAESETKVGEDGRYHAGLPEEIAEIVDNGGVDPREWVAEWVEESIGLAVGTVAQRYVARRMGVGEGRGDLNTKRANENVMADGGGEAARAGI